MLEETILKIWKLYMLILVCPPVCIYNTNYYLHSIMILQSIYIYSGYIHYFYFICRNHFKKTIQVILWVYFNFNI